MNKLEKNIIYIIASPVLLLCWPLVLGWLHFDKHNNSNMSMNFAGIHGAATAVLFLLWIIGLGTGE